MNSSRSEIAENWTGPDYDDEPETSSDDRCICIICEGVYEVWTDPADGRPCTWCCEPCWAKPEPKEEVAS